jgi:hypothetical protein
MNDSHVYAASASRSIVAQAAAAPAATPASTADAAPSAPNVRGELHRLFTRAIHAAYPGIAVSAELKPCANPKFGDYQCVPLPSGALPFFRIRSCDTFS